jgi:WD40 repeat protein/serine/threonine protein kinase
MALQQSPWELFFQAWSAPMASVPPHRPDPGEPVAQPTRDPDASRYDALATRDPADPDASRYDPTAAGATELFGAAEGTAAMPRARRVGEYELLIELGRGGMGIVYKARDLKLNRLVALKMIRGGGHASAAEVQRFLSEAQAVARLDHPHIVPIFEIGTADGLPYFVMGLVDGGSLKQRLADGPLPPRVAARLLQQVAEGVHHAHEHGVIHRDLKPHNILLQRDDSGSPGTPASASSPGITQPPGGSTLPPAPGSVTAKRAPSQPTPRVSDFGLARLVGEDGLTITGEVLGTPSYMAPEQAAGHVRELGPAADVYGLGAVLYELLTGRPPFQAATPTETLRLVQDQEPVPPRRLNSGVPRDLQTICLKCLEKIPRRRYATAADLAADLGRFLAGEPVQAQPPSVVYRMRKFIGRHRVALAVTAAVLLLLIGGTVAAFIGIDRQRRAALAANQQLQEQLYDNSIAVAERELTLNQDVSLASDLLDRCPEHLRGWEWDYLVRLRDGTRQPLTGHTKGLWMAAFSPDGRRIATASIDGTAKVWDADTGQLQLTYKGHAIFGISLPGVPSVPVMCLAFSPDGKHIASGSFTPNPLNLRDSRGVVKVWSPDDGHEVLTFTGQQGVILSVTYSPDGNQIASSSINEDHSFVVWDAATGKNERVIRAHAMHVHKLRYSPDGRLLASASTDGVVKLWNAQTLQLVRSIEAHRAPVVDVAFSPDGSRLATASEDSSVGVWETATGAAVFKLRGHTGSALGVAYSPDGKRIATGGFDKTVRVWDAATGKEKITLRHHKDMVWSVAFSPDGRRIVSSSYDSTAIVWDTTPRQDPPRPGVFTITGHHTDRVTMVAFSRDGLIASGSMDETVRLWDGQSGELLRTLEGHKAPVLGTAFSPDGKRVASASWDHTLKIWDTGTGNLLATCTGHTAPVQSVSFSPDGKRLASAGWDSFVMIWDAETGKRLVTCEGDLYPTVAVAFAPDGKRVACGRANRSVVLWDAQTGKSLLTLTGHEAVVPCVAFSPDGERLASASWDHTAKIWDVTPDRKLHPPEGRLLHTLKGHGERVNGVAFSPDGMLLATASEDKTVRTWDVRTGEELLPRRLHRGLVWSVAFSPDGKRLASGCWSPSGWIKTWEVARPPAGK